MARSHMASASGFLFLEYCSNARSRSPGYFCIISSNTTTSSMPWKDLPVVRTFLGWQIRAQDDIVQGDPSGWSLALVDIKTKVPSQLYAKNITFIFMSTRASNQLDGYPCKKWGWAKKGGNSGWWPSFFLVTQFYARWDALRKHFIALSDAAHYPRIFTKGRKIPSTPLSLRKIHSPNRWCSLNLLASRRYGAHRVQEEVVSVSIGWADRILHRKLKYIFCIKTLVASSQSEVESTFHTT